MNDLQIGLLLILAAASIAGLLLMIYVALFDYLKWTDIPLAFVVGFLGTLFFAAGAAAVWILFLGLVVIFT